jgi:hypothetical protein
VLKYLESNSGHLRNYFARRWPFRDRLLAALLRELHGDESFIAPDHFAISPYSAVLEETQGKMMRQVRERMLDPEARSDFRNVPDQTVQGRSVFSEAQRCGTSRRAAKGLPLLVTLVKHFGLFERSAQT